MSRAVNAIVVGVAVFVLVTGSLWYFLVAQRPDKLAVVAVDYDWATVNEESGELVGTVTFRNALEIDVRLEGFRYEYSVNGILLAANESHEKALVKAEQEHKAPISLKIPTGFVSEWFASHAKNGEESEALLKGEALVLLNDRNQTVGFQSRSSWSTSIAKSLGGFENCDDASDSLCVAKTSAEWATTDSGAVLRLKLSLRNPTKDGITVDNSSIELRLAGAPVGDGATSGIAVPADGEEEAEWDIYLDHAQLVNWWPRHVQGCEESSADAKGALTLTHVREDDPTSSPSQSPAPSPKPSFTPSSPPSSPSPTTSPTPSSSSPPPSSSSPPPSSSPAPTSSSAPPTNSTAPSSGLPTNTSLALGALAAPRTAILLRLTLQGDGETENVEWTLEADAFTSRFACESR